jgi:hypothetical protein
VHLAPGIKGVVDEAWNTTNMDHTTKKDDQNTNPNPSRTNKTSQCSFEQIKLQNNPTQLYNKEEVRGKKTILMSKSTPLLPRVSCGIPKITPEENVFQLNLQA